MEGVIFPERSHIELQRSTLFLFNKKESALSLLSSARVKNCELHFLSWGPIFIQYKGKWYSCLHISLNWGLSHSLLHSNPCSQQLPHSVPHSSSFIFFNWYFLAYTTDFLLNHKICKSQSSIILIFPVYSDRSSMAVLPVVSSAAITLIKMFLRVWTGLIPSWKDTSFSLVPMATNSSVTPQQRVFSCSHSKRKRKSISTDTATWISAPFCYSEALK